MIAFILLFLSAVAEARGLQRALLTLLCHLLHTLPKLFAPLVRRAASLSTTVQATCSQVIFFFNIPSFPHQYPFLM